MTFYKIKFILFVPTFIRFLRKTEKINRIYIIFMIHTQFKRYIIALYNIQLNETVY